MGLPAEVLSQIPQEYHSSVEKFSDIGSLVKSHSELEKYQGRSVAIPQETDTPDVKARWKIDHLPKLNPVLGDMLPPPKPEDYEFKFDGVTPDQVNQDKVIQLFRGGAHKLGLSKAQAQGVAEFFTKEIAPQFKPQETAPPPEFITGDAVKGIMAEVFKGEATQQIDEYKKGVMVLKQSIPEIEDFLNEGIGPYGQKYMANGDHPVMVKIINLFGKMTGADFSGTTGANAEAGKTAHDEIMAIMHDKNHPKHERFLKGSGDPQMQEYLQELWRATTGGR